MQSGTHDGEAAGRPDAGAPLPSIESHFSWLRTRLSEERTLMSWNRTSLTVIAFGFTIYQWFEQAQQGSVAHPRATRDLAAACVLIGTVGTLVALVQYLDGLRWLRGDEFRALRGSLGLPYISLTLCVATFCALIGIATTVWILRGG
jgi:putative membrane protein